MQDAHKTREQLITELTALRQRLTAADAACTQVELALHASEEWMRQAQNLEILGTLAGGVVHDLNNFLTIIAGHAELALEFPAQPGRMESSMQEILRAAERAQDVIHQLSSLSRQTEPQMESLQLGRIVEEALRLLRILLPDRIELQTHISYEAGTVLANATQMHQVVINLTTNAIHAMRDTGGSLEVRLEPVDVDTCLAAQHSTLSPGPYMCITVRDTGHGMPSEVTERIFEPFFTQKPVGEGTGLGLASVKNIITRHGGTITVVSAPQQGTTLAVYLPRINQTSHPSRRPTTAPEGGAGGTMLCCAAD